MNAEDIAPLSGEREWIRRALTLEAAATLFAGRLARHAGAEERSLAKIRDDVTPSDLTEE